MKISVIDLGYNSIKMINYNVRNDNFYEAYEQIGLKIKIGEGLDDKGFLGRKAVWRTIDSLKLFRDIINLQSIKYVMPFATSAVREAGNREEFLNEVHDATGFKFKVLTEKEEAWYSYCGAIKSMQLPNVLFFDLGGGSLELVYAEKFKIKKTISLPLGALRVTQRYREKNGMISEKKYELMSKYILDLLPSSKELAINNNTLLVGVGGTLRALTKYHQKVTKYPLDKIHNYRMDKKSVNSICKKLAKFTPDEIAKEEIIGTNRSESIIAGSCVVNMLMEKLGFEKIYVSSQGLREGALSLYLKNPKTFHTKGVSPEQIYDSVTSTSKSEINSKVEKFVKGLISTDMITERENVILSYALKYSSEKASFSNPLNWFYFIIDEDSVLNHNDQLVFALSLVRSKNSRIADWLFSRYESILTNDDKSSIKKISAGIIIFKILEQTGAEFEIKSINTRTIDLNVTQTKPTFPKILLQNAIKYFEGAFNISVIHSVFTSIEKSDSTPKN